MSTKFRGTGVAIVTPFHADGSIDFQSLGKIVNHIIANGVDYVVVLGTTGESATLSKDEKSAVVNHVLETVNKRVPVVIGIGGNNTQEIVNTIKTTDLSEIDAILSVSPYYNKPTQEGLYQHYKAVAHASPLPVILYNVPGRTSSNIEAETTLRLAEMGNIIAIKEASGSLEQCMTIIKHKPNDFLLISGDDPLTLPIIACGGDGVISVTANAFPKEFSTLVNSALDNDLDQARTEHYKLCDLFNPLFRDGNPAGIKAALELLGLCESNLRLPLVPVTADTYKELKELVNGIRQSSAVEV